MTMPLLKHNKLPIVLLQELCNDQYLLEKLIDQLMFMTLITPPPPTILGQPLVKPLVLREIHTSFGSF